MQQQLRNVLSQFLPAGVVDLLVSPSPAAPSPSRSAQLSSPPPLSALPAADQVMTDLDTDSNASDSQVHRYSVPRPRRGPMAQQKKTLVLDLDETLIHSTSRGSRNHDHMIEVLVDRHVCLYYVYKRPHADYFLRKVSEWYKVVIFTASMPEYADPVIDWLDSSRTLISRRYFRQSCTPRNGTYVKNLSLVDPDLSQVILVDNSLAAFAMNEDNGIPIESWMNNPNDEALLDLLPFLDALRFTHDVRSVLSLRA
ncbi:NLI interacting factor-like phosphatase-domain-containing protein [Polychytrium aggregatum]|uniref:NLI interacting factor-like phosphatase-domain-containing protein n=1 Tax=Polychytrium aggregatum TaxID=110093 RepID=UPI0022FEA5C7|nr:NLI interacting factor-like phosphatase-domain-containing protein [Polychytrium aggregatum]KAI9207592.1 NLI interacting factor-like phosphatase-domain-containing protein [Polychytrium aggregatum]